MPSMPPPSTFVYPFSLGRGSGSTKVRSSSIPSWIYGAAFRLSSTSLTGKFTRSIFSTNSSSSQERFTFSTEAIWTLGASTGFISPELFSSSEPKAISVSEGFILSQSTSRRACKPTKLSNSKVFMPGKIIRTASKDSILRPREKETAQFFNQQFYVTGICHCPAFPVPVEDRVVFQMDQAASQNQGLLS